jgi:hypothetical protein
LIAYAAKAGTASIDGAGTNSPFTSALVKYIAQPGLDIRIALGKVRDDVLANTNNRQEPFVYGSLGGGDVSLVPATGALASVDPDAAAAADYERAERVGSLQAWQAFLVMHSTGYYASLARAQLAKRMATDPTALPAVAQGTQRKADRLIKPSPLDDIQHKQEEAARLKAGGEAALQPSSAAGPAPLTPDQACKSDSARLALLRVNPSAEEVAKFSRELACEKLRPQVRRFMESFGLEPINENTGQPVAADPAASAKPFDIAVVCKHDADELARIRANLDRESAIRFAHDFKCEKLRAQVSRLLDSIGD